MLDNNRCWVPLCKYDRRYRKAANEYEWRFKGDPFIWDLHMGIWVDDHKKNMKWKHRGQHLICTRCGMDGT